MEREEPPSAPAAAKPAEPMARAPKLVPPPPPVDRPAPKPPAAKPTPFEQEVSVDFDALLKSLGASDRPAPPMVEALLTEPAPIPPRPEPVLPELPIEKPSADAHAALRRGLQEFDAPASARPQSPASFGGAAPPVARPEPPARFGESSSAPPRPAAKPAPPAEPLRYGEVAPVAPSDAAGASEPMGSYGEVSFEQVATSGTHAAPVTVASGSSPSLAGQAEASFGAVSPKRPSAAEAEARPESQASAGENREGGPEVSKEQMILDELEAWLAAIKR